MSNMHPLWQAEDEQNVPITQKSTSSSHSKQKELSRKPAAIIGMLIVIGIGFFLFQGLSGITAQVSDGEDAIGIEAPEGRNIRITSNSFLPNSIVVEHGETIVWTNTSTVPHSIESETLCSDTGFCLFTNTLFEGESDSFTVTPDIRPGTYTYISNTTADMQGEIIIENTAVSERNVAPIDQNTDTTEEDDFFGRQSTNQGIPTNPYTVDSVRTHPFDGNDGTSNVQAAATETTFTPRSRPLRQPSTGAGLVFVIAGSMIGIYAASKRSFAVYSQHGYEETT